MLFRYYVPEPSQLLGAAQDAELPVEPLPGRPKKDILGVWRMARAMKRSGCSLVHAHDPVSLPLAAAAAGQAKVPLQVATWDGSDSEGGGPSSQDKSFRALDLIIVREEESRAQLTEQGFASETIRIIPPGRDFSSYTQPAERDFLHRELGLEQDIRLIGVKTRFQSTRTWSFLKRLQQALGGGLPGTRVIVLGEGTLEIGQGGRRAAPPEGFLYYLGGSAPFSRVIASLDLLVVLDSEVDDRERLQAAMAAGVPLVTSTRRGLPRELVHEKTGLRFPPGDPLALVQPLSRYVKNRELGSRLAREGQVAVLGKHSVQAMARRLIKEYERIARRKGISLERMPASEEPE
jgi:glycosyltransferase involved in cell wall biosynthesis